MMSRTRFQEGSLAVQGKGKAARYVTRFRVYAADGTFVQKKVVIGFVSTMSKREATKQKALIVAKQTSQLPQAVSEARKGETTFKSFYEDRFLGIDGDW